MKCPVCNETEVVPTKEGAIPDCPECQSIAEAAAEYYPIEQYEQDWYHPDLTVWEVENHYYPDEFPLYDQLDPE